MTLSPGSCRIAIFASGNGSNAMALIQSAKKLKNVKVELVLSDKKSAAVLGKAQAENVKTYLIEKTTDRAHHENEILNILREHQIDWIFLAGYMRLLSAHFLKEFSALHQGQARIVNIHPSLLPAYPGADSIARAFQDQVSESGVTLHYVDEGMDTGKIIRQERLRRVEAQDLSSWSQQFHQLEHQIYTDFLKSLEASCKE